MTAACLHQLGNRLDHIVSSRMAICVVDLLEKIDVHHDHRMNSSRIPFRKGFDRQLPLLQVVFEATSVEQTRKHVGSCLRRRGRQFGTLRRLTRNLPQDQKSPEHLTGFMKRVGEHHKFIFTSGRHAVDHVFAAKVLQGQQIL